MSYTFPKQEPEPSFHENCKWAWVILLDEAKEDQAEPLSMKKLMWQTQQFPKVISSKQIVEKQSPDKRGNINKILTDMFSSFKMSQQSRMNDLVN